MSPLISFIISTRGKNSSILANALSSIFNTVNSEQVEVIVVDQNQSLEIEKVCLLWQANGIKYIATSTVGLARGRNIGVKEAKGDWLWFFDDDAILSKDWLVAIFSSLTASRVESKIFYGTVYDLAGKKYLRRGSNSHRLHRWQFDGVCSIGIIFNRRALDKIGEYDEKFGVGSTYGAGEESDMILRALNFNIPVIFNADLKTIHPRFERDLAKASNYGFGIGALYRKHFFVSLENFVVLFIKLLLENIVRLLFIGFFGLIGRSVLAKFHLNYLMGFWRGFISYRV